MYTLPTPFCVTLTMDGLYVEGGFGSGTWNLGSCRRSSKKEKKSDLEAKGSLNRPT